MSYEQPNSSSDEVNYDYVVYDDRVSSDGEESQLEDGTTLPAAINETFQLTRNAASFYNQRGNNQNGECVEEDSDSAQRWRTSHFMNMQETQNNSQNDSKYFECDECGSFFCDDELKSGVNRKQGLATLCPKCRKSAASNSSHLHEVSSSDISSPTCKHPCTQKWSGLYNFSIEVIVPSHNRHAYLYSSLLNKLYTTMNVSIPIQFRCRWGIPDLYVRVVPVFLREITEPVVRCAHHMRLSEETNAGFAFADHVIRCQHDMCLYERDESSGRLSVVAPLGNPAPGSDSVTIIYKFMCSTSCLGGMNRRPIQVIFTLERHNKEVIGRSTVHVRVCSCPCRDMKKEEFRLSPRNDESKPRTENLPSPLISCKLCKRPGFENEDRVTYIPVYGDKSMAKKAVMLLRSNLIGEKLAASQELTKDEQLNWKIFNKLISDGAGPSGS